MSTINYGQQSITLKPGECFTLPANAELLYVSDPSAIESECEIPPTFPTSCYYIAWENDNLGDYEVGFPISMIIDGVNYTFESEVNMGANNAATTLLAAMQDTLPAGVLVEGEVCSATAFLQAIRFTSVAKDIKFVLGDEAVGAGEIFIYLIPTTLETCNCPS